MSYKYPYHVDLEYTFFACLFFTNVFLFTMLFAIFEQMRKKEMKETLKKKKNIDTKWVNMKPSIFTEFFFHIGSTVLPFP